MDTELTPLAGISIILLGILFITLFIAWCCKECSQSKQIIAPLLSPPDSLYNRHYMTAVDVQTGLPVIIQTVGRNSRNLVRVTPLANGGRCSMNAGPFPTNYGSTAGSLPPISEVSGRSPPPSYFQVCHQPTA